WKKRSKLGMEELEPALIRFVGWVRASLGQISVKERWTVGIAVFAGMSLDTL
ncbi:hypothetical protein BD779DRAFT_1554554, partial [Infundibulicybe gibba]